MFSSGNASLAACPGPKALLETGVWVIFLEIFKHLMIPEVAGVDFPEALN